MKFHLDCDVLLDVALNRKEFVEASSTVLDWAQQNPGKASVSWHTLANLNYMFKTDARPFIQALCEFLDIPPSSNSEITVALALELKDFEDAMQVAAAQQFGAQVIVTRNTKDYALSPIKALTPKEWLEIRSN
jgi:predicted nucleic acid-binding protein